MTEYRCGPLLVGVTPDTGPLHDKVAETLRLYDHPWRPSQHRVTIALTETATRAQLGAGAILTCSRMMVDGDPANLDATTTTGARARSTVVRARRHWSIEVPPGWRDTRALEEVEDLVNLVLTQGWRDAGWVPVHAAAVTKRNRCVLICASSGGGKSTLTAAFVRRGWHAVGDDKVLMRERNGRTQIAALQRTFNLHPRTRAWFPEVGRLERLPRYSTYTDKRKIRADAIWPDSFAARARPTHIVQVRRDPTQRAISVRPLTRESVFSTLVGQIVVPFESGAAKFIMSTAGSAARELTGVEATIGKDAYAQESCFQELEAALR